MDYLRIVLLLEAEARNLPFEIQTRVMRETDSPFDPVDPAEEEGQKSFTMGW